MCDGQSTVADMAAKRVLLASLWVQRRLTCWHYHAQHYATHTWHVCTFC